MNPGFRGVIGELVASSRVMVDHPKDGASLRFPENIYPLDDGYMEGTTSSDGQGIDVWLGSGDPHQITAVLRTADLKKCDAELNLRPGYTLAEAQAVVRFLNVSPQFQGLPVPRL